MKKVLVAFVAFDLVASASAQKPAPAPKQDQSSHIQVGSCDRYDVSPPLREIVERLASSRKTEPRDLDSNQSQVPFSASLIPEPILNFEGVPYGIATNGNRFPPDPNGAVGSTQYVQAATNGFEIFNKSTGASLLGPVPLSTLWADFSGPCEGLNSSNKNEPMVIYDQLANRWVIARAVLVNLDFPNYECVAVSTTSDATGSYHRYGFALNTNQQFINIKLVLWPDAYYMSADVLNPSFLFLGPQPFAFNRTKMLNGELPTYLTPGLLMGAQSVMPAAWVGSMPPPAGAPETFVGFPANGQYTIYHFHADFDTPSNTTWTTFATPAVTTFTPLCPTTSSCVPQPDTAVRLSGLGRTLMFPLAYRNFGDHESLIGNFSVNANDVAGIRWFELRNVTNGPVTVSQEGTYQPDTTWRWNGSATMDRMGNVALGFSASSSALYPSIRYTGRLVTDPPNTLPQGEATLIAGSGSQTGFSIWGNYSSMSVDPVDGCTFWYTNEYYDISTVFGWRTRIGNFKFKECQAETTPTPTPTSTPIPSPSPSPTPTATPNFPPCSFGTATFFRLENFDNVTPPTLPNDWIATNAIGDAPTWVTSDTGNPTPAADSAPNSAFVSAPSTVSDNRLESPTISNVYPHGVYLIFRHNFDLQEGSDGGVLEISSFGGEFEEVTAGQFVTGGYNSTISTASANPLAGRQVWSGNSGGFITSIVRLCCSSSSETLPTTPIIPFKLRWRLGTDASVSGAGWRVDSIDIRYCAFFGTPPYLTPTPTPTPTLTPTPTPAVQALNISTRLHVGTGDGVMIGGFIVTGNDPKTVAIRGIGPSLVGSGLTDVLADPTLELRDSTGTLLMQNDNWQDNSAQAEQLTSLGLALPNSAESGIVATLAPGAYTAVLAGTNQTSGIGLIEIYDADSTADSKLANLSTRGLVQTGSNVMIGGFILGHGSGSSNVILRGIGPSLGQSGLTNFLVDPTLELRDSNGALLVGNDNWEDDSTSATQLTAHGLAPQNSIESGIFANLTNGSYTAILSGKNGGIGIGLVEIYQVSSPP